VQKVLQVMAAYTLRSQGWTDDDIGKVLKMHTTEVKTLLDPPTVPQSSITEA
jgi:hypothetical protein